MDDLTKIDLITSKDLKPDSREHNLKESKYETKRIPVFIKILLPFLIAIVLIVVVSFFAIVLPAKKTYSSAVKTYQQAKSAWSAVKKQNVTLASEELAKTKKDLLETQENLHGLSYVRFVPILSGYYSDADHLTNAGFHALDAATVLVDALKPYADILGLKGAGSFVMGSAEQRIQTAVLTMGKITPRIDDIANSLVLSQKEIDEVDPNHYPSFVLNGKIRTQLQSIQRLSDQGVVFVKEARPLIKVLPNLLGESKEKKYLVLFQNDKELRPTGGFITAYAIFRIDKGIIHIDRSSDIYDLDNSRRTILKAPEPILKYLPKVYSLNLRDSNLSPDFIESMKTFYNMYKDTTQQIPIDGIIALDTHVLVSTIKILDDKVETAGFTFTSKEEKKCNCPQVIYVLEDNISRPVNYVKTGRKDLLGALLYAILGKALKSSPKVYWGLLFQNILTEVSQKHVLFYLFNDDAQKGVVSLNAAGKIMAFNDGDYLHINEANFAGGKANLYVEESVDQNIEVTADGSITKTVVVTYKNPFPPSDCDLESGGLCLNAPLRDWVRFYVPKGSTLLDSVGSEVKVSSYEEFGKTVFEGFLTVRPLGQATYTLKYKLPFSVKPGSTLPLLIQKQPGTDKNQYTVKVNGKKTNQFELTTDKEIKLKI